MRRQGMVPMLFPDSWLRNVDRSELADRLERLFGGDLADSPPIIREQLRAMKPYDASARLKELAGIPTLVVSGRHDPIAPAMAGKTLVHNMPGAQYVEFEDASHALPIQSADQLNALLLDHLAASGRFVETRARD
jgi:pimeloyl-ACP methyl ester carboxylesterase